jgi:hypothetical protein
VVEDLKREPWARRDRRPAGSPQPSAPILDDPAYRGAEWKEVCRVQLKKCSMRESAKELRQLFGIVAVAIESKDGLACGLDTPLEAGGFLLFGWEKGQENWFGLRELLGLDEDTDPKDVVERVWLPVYKFEVPEAYTGQSWSKAVPAAVDAVDGQSEGFLAHGLEAALKDGVEQLGSAANAIVAAALASAPFVKPEPSGKAQRFTSKSKAKSRFFLHSRSAMEWTAPELCGAVFRGDTQWFPSDDIVFRQGDQMVLPQGSVQNFAMLRARALFGGHCVGAGSKMVYSLTMPQEYCRRSEEDSESADTEEGTASSSTDASAPAAVATTGKRSNFEHTKVLVMRFLDMPAILAMSGASHAGYRASRMPQFRPHAETYGIVTVGVDAPPNQHDTALLFGFPNDVPHEKGLSLFCGFDQDPKAAGTTKTAGMRMEQTVEGHWIPVFNFLVPNAWVGHTLGYVLDREDFMVIGIRRQGDNFSRQLWFPARNEQIGSDDEIIFTMEMACRFAAKYLNLPQKKQQRSLKRGAPRTVALRPALPQSFCWDWDLPPPEEPEEVPVLASGIESDATGAGRRRVDLTYSV